MRVEHAAKPARYCGVDDFNRPVIKDEHGNFYCDVDTLFSSGQAGYIEGYKHMKQFSLEHGGRLHFKGRNMQGEPDREVSTPFRVMTIYF